MHQNLSDQFVEKHKHRIEYCCGGIHSVSINNLWCIILSKPTISEKYIEENIDKIDFNYMELDYVSEEFLIKYEDKVNWVKVYQRNKLSSILIDKHIKNKFYIDNLSYYRGQYLSYWDKISKYQILSETFIETYKDRLNWYFINRYQTHLSQEFRDLYCNEYYLDY